MERKDAVEKFVTDLSLHLNRILVVAAAGEIHAVGGIKQFGLIFASPYDAAFYAHNHRKFKLMFFPIWKKGKKYFFEHKIIMLDKDAFANRLSTFLGHEKKASLNKLLLPLTERLSNDFYTRDTVVNRMKQLTSLLNELVESGKAVVYDYHDFLEIEKGVSLLNSNDALRHEFDKLRDMKLRLLKTLDKAGVPIRWEEFDKNLNFKKGE